MASKNGGNSKAKPRANGRPGSLTLDILDRIQGKETTVSLDLEKVGLDLGEKRRIQAHGTVKLNIVTLR